MKHVFAFNIVFQRGKIIQLDMWGKSDESEHGKVHRMNEKSSMEMRCKMKHLFLNSRKKYEFDMSFFRIRQKISK